MNTQMLMAPLLMMGISKLGLDYEDPTTLFSIRCAFAVAQGLVVLSMVIMYLKITSKNDSRMVKVPVELGVMEKAQRQADEAQNKADRDEARKNGTPLPPLLETPKQITKMTIAAYDVTQLKKLGQATAIGLCITLGIHYKWSFVQPLIMQCMMTPMKLYKNPLFKLHILGADEDAGLRRPFKQDDPANMFKGLMPEEPKERAPRSKKKSRKVN